MASENYTQESDDHHSGTNTDFLIRLARPVRANVDGHFPVKASEEIEQLVGGEAGELQVHQVRDFRLFDAEQRRDLTLLELSSNSIFACLFLLIFRQLLRLLVSLLDQIHILLWRGDAFLRFLLVGM